MGVGREEKATLRKKETCLFGMSEVTSIALFLTGDEDPFSFSLSFPKKMEDRERDSSEFV